MTRRDRLRARAGSRPTATVGLPQDPAGYAEAEAALERADATVRAARAAGLEDLDDVEQALAAARAELAELPVEVFELRCLTPRAWDDLVNDHPPTDEQRRQGWAWNVDSFRPALLAETVITPDEDQEEPLTARHWVEVAEEGELTPGELELLFATAVGLNQRQPRLDLGKG